MAKSKLLVPVDGSGPAMRALRVALKVRDAVVLVLNVQPAMPRSRFVSKTMIAEHQKRTAEEALAPARVLIKRLKLDVQTYTVVGDPAAAIVAFANKHRCSAIVMGSRGKGLIPGLTLGSVAAKVVYLAECPVTLVK